MSSLAKRTASAFLGALVALSVAILLVFLFKARLECYAVCVEKNMLSNYDDAVVGACLCYGERLRVSTDDFGNYAKMINK